MTIQLLNESSLLGMFSLHSFIELQVLYTLSQCSRFYSESTEALNCHGFYLCICVLSITARYKVSSENVLQWSICSGSSDIATECNGSCINLGFIAYTGWKSKFLITRSRGKHLLLFWDNDINNLWSQENKKNSLSQENWGK